MAAPEPRHPTRSLIDREWERLGEVIDGLPAAEMERPAFDAEFGDSPWTVKILLVHMAAWKRNMLRVVEMVRADPSSVPSTGTPDEILRIDFDGFNLEQQARWGACSLDEALAEHRAAHAVLLEALATLPDEAIPLPASRNIWPYPAIWHVKAHRLDIIDALG